MVREEMRGGNVTGCGGAGLRSVVGPGDWGKRKQWGQRSKVLGREGGAGAGRMCRLGAGKGERGGARNLGLRTLVPGKGGVGGRGADI